jgi:hypothetical protein
VNALGSKHHVEGWDEHDENPRKRARPIKMKYAWQFDIL